ncbi:hypothetical protein HY640_00540 [Candidatus Woesearchaeota archaeon]|nr:hypothetical protein [Candidatus Woesearchaeota archaeon]
MSGGRRVGRRGEVWISVVIYVMVVVVVMVIVIEAGLPILRSVRDRAAFSRVKDTMSALDQHIVDIANEGPGSQRVIPLEVPKGDVRVSGNRFLWKLETETKLVEPRTKIDQGSLVIASDVDVSVTDYGSHYIIENSRVLLNVSRFGSPDNWSGINTSALINYVEFKEQSSRTAGIFKFLVQNMENSSNGTGYTYLVERGTGLTTGTVVAHVNASNQEYDLRVSLDSKADFFRAAIENFRAK